MTGALLLDLSDAEPVARPCGCFYAAMPAGVAWSRSEVARLWEGDPRAASTLERTRLGGLDLQQQMFAHRAEQWRRETRNMSSIAQKVMHPAYQSIMAMGPSVVWMILERLAHEPDDWFWALRHLTGADPVSPEARGNLKAMAQAWLRWGRVQGYR